MIILEPTISGSPTCGVHLMCGKCTLAHTDCALHHYDCLRKGLLNPFLGADQAASLPIQDIRVRIRPEATLCQGSLKMYISEDNPRNSFASPNHEPTRLQSSKNLKNIRKSSSNGFQRKNWLHRRSLLQRFRRLTSGLLPMGCGGLKAAGCKIRFLF